MTRIYQFPMKGKPRPQALGPEDLRIAVNAFEAALHAFDESACGSPAHSTRRRLARYVIERALTGERDFEALRDGAVRYVKSVELAEKGAVACGQGGAL